VFFLAQLRHSWNFPPRQIPGCQFSMGSSRTLAVFVMLFEEGDERYHSDAVVNNRCENKSNLNC